MKFTVRKVIIPMRFRQQPDLLAKFYILIQKKFNSKILYIYYIYIYIYIYYIYIYYI